MSDIPDGFNSQAEYVDWLYDNMHFGAMALGYNGA